MKQRREQIYNVLHQFGPLTSHEINRQFVGVSRQSQPDVPAHLKEMIEMGWIREAGKMQCSVTGLKVTSFEVTPKESKAS